jgi:hypothetical protein
MEKRINTKIEQYIIEFKNRIRDKVSTMDMESMNKGVANDLIEFVYEYPRLILTKDDLNKRKRIKNTIPSSNRCNACRASGEQCTRRRKENSEFCGTHAKGTPNGLINENSTGSQEVKRIEVFVEEIFGIVYYIDSANNVYKTEDVLDGKLNPEIIAKYVKENERYTIPELGLV